MTLTAQPRRAGLFTTGGTVFRREHGAYGRVIGIHRKGGWIELTWEDTPGVFKLRTIITSRERAIQAMNNLEKSEYPV